MTNVAAGDPKSPAPQLFIPAGWKGEGQPPLYTAAQVAALKTGNHEELAHELFAAAQLAPGEGIEDAVSRIAAALTAAPFVSDGLRTLHEAILNRLSHAELLEKAHYLMELNSNQTRTIGELQDLVEAATAQPAAPQGVAYAELSDEHAAFETWARLRSDWRPNLERKGDGYVGAFANEAWRGWSARAPHGQAPAAGAVAGPTDDEILNRTGTGYAPGTREYDLDLIRWYRERIATPPAPAADSVLEDAARATLFTTPYQRGEMAGDGKPCNNDHDPDCRWPDCICRHREARFDAARKQGGTHDNH